MSASGTLASVLYDAPEAAQSMAACASTGNASRRTIIFIADRSPTATACLHGHSLLSRSDCSLCIHFHPAHVSVEIFDLDADLFEILLALLLVVSDLPEGVFDLGFKSRRQFLQLVNIVLYLS